MRVHEAIAKEMPPDLSHRAEMLLEFWFTPGGPSERDRLHDIWFEATPEFAAAIAEHFRADYDRATAGVYEPWRDAPQTCLALILLLDQLPRNLFRSSPRAYATDAAALATASEAVARGYDCAVAPLRRCFFYLPFQHSESLADQETGIRLYAAHRDFAVDAWAEIEQRSGGARRSDRRVWRRRGRARVGNLAP
jgi:uncharacterized protein (DUF924 family)